MFNRHYIRIDSSSRIIEGFSDAFEQPKPTDILINNQGGRQFELLGQANPSLLNEDGTPQYKWSGTEVQRRTDAEIEADRQAIPPAPLDPVTILQLALAEMVEAGNNQAVRGTAFAALAGSPEVTGTWAISSLYASLIDRSKPLRTLEQVPEQFRTEVELMLVD